jgi:asparagine synthase (glutamine-hydrolysing)
MTYMFGIVAKNFSCLGKPGSSKTRSDSSPAEPLTEGSVGPVTVAWTGSHGGLARRGLHLAVVDGCFCNREELPSEANDAERLLDLYERHGFEGALTRLCGGFAVAVYDGKEDTLWLGRDRVGIRPLYYTWGKTGFGFASHSLPLLSLLGVSTEVNRTFAALFAASHYRTIDNDRQASPYKDIRQLPAAHLACIHNGQMDMRRWWELHETPDFTETEAILAERYRELIFTAVSQRLKCTRKPAFTLSGGMDSSSVLASALQLTGRQQHAYSSVYADPTFDESSEIADMLEDTAIQWHPVRIDQFELVDTIAKMVAVHGEPVATATWLSHWFLCQKVAEAGCDTLFGGLGGDELNAGEYEYFFFHFADLRVAGRETDVLREITAWAEHHDHPVWRKNRHVAENHLARLVDFSIPGQCLADRRRIERYIHVLRPEYFDLTAFEPVMESPFRSYLKNRTWQDLYYEAAPCCLRAEDRQTKASGLINMDPFYDHRLLEFMFRVPGDYKIRDGVTKILLRSAMKDVLPQKTRTRIKKTGWNAPAHLWFTGKQADMLRDWISSSGFLAADIYKPAALLDLLDEHCAIIASGHARENHMMFFWQMINLETWLEFSADQGSREWNP